MIANEDAGREWECFFARLNVNKYMKEILGNIKQQTLLLLLSMVMFVMLFVPLAGAEVYKCKSADGKTSFSDQPCATGQKSAVIKPQTVGVGATSSSKGDYKSRPEYPECLRLRNKLADYFSNLQIEKTPKNLGELTVGDFMGGETVLAEIRKDMARYEEICGVFDKESAREEEKKQELAENFENERSIEESKRLVAIYECAAKRRVLGERRPKFASLSVDEKRLFTLIEVEVARDCK